MSVEDLRARAEALIAEGDLAEGMPLLLRTLDEEPAFFESLEALSVVAAEDEAWRDELFARLQRAVERAPSRGALKRAHWFQLAHAAFYDRMELVRSVLRTPEVLVEDDPAMQAAIGALVFDLGERDRGEALIVEANAQAGAGAVVAVYDWARVSWDLGREQFASDTLSERLGKKGVAGIMREVGLALFGLAKPDIDSIARAKSAVTRAEQSEDPLGPHLYSEVLFLKMRIALVEGKTADAGWAAAQLGMPVHEHDPGVMRRAREWMGPLYRLAG